MEHSGEPAPLAIDTVEASERDYDLVLPPLFSPLPVFPSPCFPLSLFSPLPVFPSPCFPLSLFSPVIAIVRLISISVVFFVTSIREADREIYVINNAYVIITVCYGME